MFLSHKESRVKITVKPGLGIEVDEDALENFTIGEAHIVDRASNKQLRF